MNGNNVLHSLHTFDLQKPGDRLYCFNVCRMIGRLLPMLASWCKLHGQAVRDLVTIKHPKKKVELAGSIVL